MTFVDFARANGLIICDLYSSSSVKRCATEDKPRKKNGAYFYDGKKGWIINFRLDASIKWWNDPNAKPWTEQDKKALHKKRLEDADRIHQKHLKAASEASQKLSECHLDTHPYLIKKNFPDEKGFIDSEGSLLIPMRDFMSNKLNGVQIIKWDNDEKSFRKKFIPGMKAKGSIYKIGAGKQNILVEGYVTGLSVYAAVKRLNMNMSVVCCFSASNMAYVSEHVGDFVMADNDESKAGEEFALKTGLPWVMPGEVNTDWNDVHSGCGIIAICKAINELKSIYKRNKTA